MKKYAWSGEQVKGLQDSIQHWEENVEKAKNGEMFSIDGHDCALCKLFYRGGLCLHCPLNIIGDKCVGTTRSTWRNVWRRNIPSVENMLQLLKDTLEAGLPDESPIHKYEEILYRQTPYFSTWDLEQEEKPMLSEYSRIKSEIEALDNGWDKRADDLLRKIFPVIDNNYNFLKIPTWGEGGKNYIEILQSSDNICKARFPYTSQCSKMSAFKKALMWLLDHSDIKKEEAIKVGDWVVDKDNVIHKISRIDGYYYDGCKSYSRDYIRLATPEEIREHLQKTEKQGKINDLENKVDDIRKEINKLKE